MRISFILAGAVIVCGAALPVSAGSLPSGTMVLAQNDDHNHQGDKGQQHPPGQGGQHGHGAPGAGQGNMGGPNHGPMAVPHGTPNGNMGGPPPGGAHNTMMMNGHNNMMGGKGHGGPKNFDRHAYQRNFTAPRHFHVGGYVRPHGWYAHHWGYGEILPAFFWTQNYWLTNYFDYGLADPPPGFVWVRDGDDALLVDTNSGEILQVEYGVFD